MWLLVEHIRLDVAVGAHGVAILVLDGHIENLVVDLKPNVADAINEFVGYIELLVKVINNYAAIVLVFDLGSVDFAPRLRATPPPSLWTSFPSASL